MSDRADSAGARSLAERSALVVGVTGIQGHTLASQLNKHGWNVTGLARRKNIDLPGVTGVSVDLTARDAVQAALPLIDDSPMPQSTHLSVSSLGPRYFPSTHS